MSPTHVARLWAALGVLALYLAVNSWLVTQGGWPILNIGLIHPGRKSAAVLALWFVPLLLVLIACLGVSYARAHRTGPWHHRIPVVCAPDLNLMKPSARLWQGLVFFWLVIFPAGACIHFWLRINKMEVIRTTDPAAAALTIWTKIRSADAGSRAFRIADFEPVAGGGRKLIGTSYVPWFETWILVGFHVLTALALVWYLWAVFRPKR